MTTWYGYINPVDWNSGNDTVRILRKTRSKAELEIDRRFDPNGATPVGRTCVVAVDQPPIQADNERLGFPEAVCICTLKIA